MQWWSEFRENTGGKIKEISCELSRTSSIKDLIGFVNLNFLLPQRLGNFKNYNIVKRKKALFDVVFVA